MASTSYTFATKQISGCQVDYISDTFPGAHVNSMWTNRIIQTNGRETHVAICDTLVNDERNNKIMYGAVAYTFSMNIERNT